MDRLFIVVYAFMATTLGLKGLVKEVFAVIFGFWLESSRKEAWVSLSTLQKITGGSRPAVINSVRILENMGLISIHRNPGKRSLYAITIDNELLRDFDSTFMENAEKTIDRKLVSRQYQHQERDATSSGNDNRVVKKVQVKKQNILLVKAKNEINTGGLPEA